MSKSQKEKNKISALEKDLQKLIAPEEARVYHTLQQMVEVPSVKFTFEIYPGCDSGPWEPVGNARLV